MDQSSITKEFFQRDPLICAEELIGCLFIWGKCSGRIVETEAYAEHGDEACHTAFKPSAREFIESNTVGTAYVYLNYGMYWLTNVLCKCPDSGNNGFVLLRALEPTTGIPAMQKRRKRDKRTELCSGPGKLSMALAINGEVHGKSLIRYRTKGFHHGTSPVDIVTDRRIGISKATERQWRFLEKDNQHVSAPVAK